MLNSSGESGYPCLVSCFRGNAFNFSPLRVMLAVGKWQTLLKQSETLICFTLCFMDSYISIFTSRIRTLKFLQGFVIISLLRYWGWEEILICPLSCHQFRIREFRISRLTNSMHKVAAVMLPRAEKSLWRKWRMLTFLGVSSLKPLYCGRKGKEINRDIISLLMGPVNTGLFACIILFFCTSWVIWRAW